MLREITDTLGPLPADALSRAEQEIGAPLPEEYKQFLLRYNGGRVEPAAFPVQWQGQSCARRFPVDAVHVLFGFKEGSHCDFIKNLRSMRERIPGDTVPVGQDPGGNLLLLGIKGANNGKVFLWVQDQEVDWEGGETPDYSNVGLVAPSFIGFLQSLRDR